MIANYRQNSFLLLLISALLTGCFKEESPIKPVSQNGVRITYSLYHYQTFYDFSTNAMHSNRNDKWDIAFESGAEGWHIRINYSNYAGIYRTESTDFKAPSYPIIERNWLYDASSGNIDSTAIGNWKEVTGEGTRVYLFGIYDGVKYNPQKKLKFLAVSDTSYTFAFSSLDNSDADTVVIEKNNDYNYTYFSFSKKDTVIIEPGKASWDILFTQYTTTLYTDEGIPTPYVVRGVYLNPNNVTTAIDTITHFNEITGDLLPSYSFSSNQDFIGYKWKSVEINQSANTARYNVNRHHSYLIKDADDQYFKFHFLSYVNDSLIVGFPKFEIEKL